MMNFLFQKLLFFISDVGMLLRLVITKENLEYFSNKIKWALTDGEQHNIQTEYTKSL